VNLIVAGPTGTVEHEGEASHPEQQGRIFSVMEGIRSLGLEDEVIYPPTPRAELGDLRRVHLVAYLAKLEDARLEVRFYTRRHGEDPPEISEWTWAPRKGATQPTVSGG
jgi:acetoin utilization deacetylase AcuC-like enzyme